ncbi:HalOD1 output domain-containing protein [Halorussus halobius]|uniref:HalOD1 output domain-containing protein n=1 Tax=Halorussus halobius TaxID=1710537 RepID=UPI0010923E96|nr:HalOD1 output domain-containing protein [Halorussus halobius]
MTDDASAPLGSVEYDPTTDAYYTNYAGDVAPPSAVVPSAIAEITGRGVETLQPLQEVVDPDALDHIFREPTGDREDVEIAFTYAGHDVTVSGSGVVVIESVACEA